MHFAERTVDAGLEDDRRCIEDVRRARIEDGCLDGDDLRVATDAYAPSNTTTAPEFVLRFRPSRFSHAAALTH